MISRRKERRRGRGPRTFFAESDQGGEVDARLRYRRPQIAETRDALRHVVDAKVFNRDPALDFLPGDRSRHAGARVRSYGIDRREGASPRVLVVVEEYAPGGALGDAVLGRHERRMMRRDLARQRLRDGPDLLLRRAARDRHVDMDAARAGRLHDARHREAGERVAQDERGLGDPREGDVLAGIEVEVEVVGSIDVVAARVPLIQVDAAEVHDPEESGHVLNDREVDDVTRSVLDGAGLDPLGPRRRCAFHEEERAGSAVGVALHDHGAVAQVRQQGGRDLQIVLKEVALRDAEVRPEWLLEVGEPDFLAFDLELDRFAALRDLNSPRAFRHRCGGGGPGWDGTRRWRCGALSFGPAR